MTEEELLALEQYIFSNHSEESLKLFPSTSECGRYLNLIRKIEADPSDPSIDSSISQISNSDMSTRVRLRQLLKKYDLTSDPELISKLNADFVAKSFDHEAPRNIENSEIETFPSKLKENVVDLGLAAQDEKAFARLTSYGKLCLKIETTSDKVFRKMLSSEQLWKYEGLAGRFVEFFKNNRGFTETECFKRMSLSQLNQISKSDQEVWKNGSFIRAWLKKEYFSRSIPSKDQERYEYFKAISCTFEGNQNLPDAIRTISYLNVLALEKKLGIIDETWFFRYLTYRRSSDWYIEEKPTDKNLASYEQFLHDRSLDENTLLNYFIPAFLFNKFELVEKFQNLFKQRYIEPIVVQTRVLKGLPIEDFPNYANLPTFNSIELEPALFNPKEFGRNEEIAFRMNIKNIPRLTVRVLELNPKNYYLKNLNEITSNIEVDGLVPSFERTLQYNHGPSIRSVETFEFPELSGKLGIFIIEFFGNGRKSRVIIKKGSLRYVSKDTISGNLIYILNEDNEICKSGGIYIDNRFFEVDPEDGHITIPFCRVASIKPIVIWDGQICELIKNFNHSSENYNLKTAFLLTQEQIVARTTCKFFVKPSLYVNGIRATNKLLTQGKITLTTVNSDSVESIKVFSEFDVPDGSDTIPVVFEVPLNLKEVMVQFSAVVESVEDEKINLTNDFSLHVNPTLGDNNTISTMFLTKVNGEFVAQIKGINGEPVVKQIVEFKGKSKLVNESISQRLQSDQLGQVYLGKLEDIESVNFIIKRESRKESYDWNISSYKEGIYYPNKIRLCEGDEFSLPVIFQPHESLSDVLWFSSLSDEYIIDDIISKLAYNPENSSLSINGLEPGSYKLEFRSGDTIIIEILEGIHLGKHFIIKENQAELTTEDYMTIGISTITKEDNQVKVNLSGKYDNHSTVFGLFFNYFSPDIISIFSNLLSLNNSSPAQTFHFSTSQNMYLKSTQLDEEYQYVIDRKSHPRFIGSTLDKPQLLLKRFFLTSTTTETQLARQGERFENACLEKCKKMMSRELSCKKKSAGGLLSKGKPVPYDFLLNPAVLITKTVEEDSVLFEVPGNYFNFIAFAYNSIGSAYKLFSLHDEAPVRDLRLKSSAKDSTEVYNTKAVFTGETMKLHDFNSTSIEIVDNLPALIKIMNCLANSHPQELSFELVDLLAEWHRLTFEVKKEKFDKFVSHELNLFIFKRDKEFFDNVVKPFLLCKMQKDFVDKYLCGFDLKEFTSFEKVVCLNNSELALLVDRVREYDLDLASVIARSLKDRAEGKKIRDIDRTLTIKAVLAANTTGGADIEEEDEEEGGGGGEEGSPRGIAISSHKRSLMKESKKCNHSSSSSSDDYKCKMQVDLKISSNVQRELSERKALPKYYKKLENTKEFKETYHYNSKTTPLMNNIHLYSDIASSCISSSPFLSESVIFSLSSPSELAFALAFIALPSRPVRPSIKITDNEWSLEASSPLLVFYRELGQSKVVLNPLILLGCTYYDSSEEEVKQFVKEKKYSCSYTITNTTSNKLHLTVLTQCPEGSIALSPVLPSKTHFLNLYAFTTETLIINFYFPFSGEFNHVPGNVALKGEICALVQDQVIKVQDNYQAGNLESFTDLVVSGKKDLILEFLEKNNLENNEKFNFAEILWMMKNQEFWASVVRIYRKKMMYNDYIWGFAFYHKDPVGVSEYLSNNPYIKSVLGYYFNSSLISTYGENFRHTEFDPIVNARAYRLGENQRITNTRFKEVYTEYLKYLSEKPQLDNSDFICLTQYFIYQERYQEAKQLYAKINLEYSKDKIIYNDLQIQYDYLTCYLDLEKAKEIVKLYEKFSVPTWCKLFDEVRSLIVEIDSEEVVQDKKRVQEPSLNFVVENESLELSYENVQQCIVRIYEIDLEVLFSKTPFLIKDLQGFSYVKPNIQFTLELSSNSHTLSLSEFKGKNILIEVDYKTSTVTKSYFSHLLVVNIIERFGIIKVMTKDHKPRPGCYVKAFVKRNSGQIEFYKDGYTDIRGKFDYVSLNTDTLNTIDKFSILVVDDELGSLVQEASPPPQ